MHRIRSEQNIKRIRNFHKRIGKNILSDPIPLKGEFRHSKDPVPFEKRLDGTYKAINIGEKWGEAWDSAWFKLSGSIPREWTEGRFALHLDFNGEALIFSDDGIPLYGLTNGSVFDSNYSKDVYRLPEGYGAGRDFEIWGRGGGQPFIRD